MITGQTYGLLSKNTYYTTKKSVFSRMILCLINYYHQLILHRNRLLEILFQHEYTLFD